MNRFQHPHNEKKVVEVFRTFFQKIVMPTMKNQPRIMYEWKYLIAMMSEDPIQLSKLDLYMTMLNHQKSTNAPAPSTGFREDSETPTNSGQRVHTTAYSQQNEYQQFGGEKEVKESREEIKRRMLGALEGFHNSLLQNQQKLQNNFKGGRNIKEPEERRYL